MNCPVTTGDVGHVVVATNGLAHGLDVMLTVGNVVGGCDLGITP